MQVNTYAAGSLRTYKYVVIFARYGNKWVFVKHRERDTLEAPGGHVEAGETTLEAARRELWEESGAVEFSIAPMFDYVGDDEHAGGTVFYADIAELGALPESEIAEVRLCEALPSSLTYPDIYAVLWPKTQHWLISQSSTAKPL